MKHYKLGAFKAPFISCNPSNYSADSIKSNLEKNGYIVEVNPTVVNLDTSKMEGSKTV